MALSPYVSTLWQYVPQEVDAFLAQYFLTPEGFVALLALFPILLFYFIKPKPERRVMPSMIFFMKKDSEGTMQSALKFLQKNLMLIFHLFLVVAFAAALAAPYMTQEAQAEEAVIVVDVSASMEPHMDEVREFVADNTADTNTVILAGERPTVQLEEAGPGTVTSFLADLSVNDVETDIVQALDLAADYPGQIVVASDLRQTVNQRSAVDKLNELQNTGRAISSISLSPDEVNRWGIIDIEPGKGNSSVDVKNFLDRSVTIPVTTGSAEQEVSIEGGAVESLSIPTDRPQTISLPEDPVTADNTGYISIPSLSNISITLLRDDRMPYFEQALSLMDGVSYTTVQNPVENASTLPRSDIYIVGEGGHFLASTAQELADRGRNGAVVIVFGQESIFDRFDAALPVRQTGGITEQYVQLTEPVRSSLGDLRAFQVERADGAVEAWASNDLVVRDRIGSGTIIYYGLHQSEFHFEFIYPVFWKRLLFAVTDRPSMDDVNRGTGDAVDTSLLFRGEQIDAPVYLDQAGFYNNSVPYAANLVSEQESRPGVTSFQPVGDGVETVESDMKHYAAILLLVLLFIEVTYLYVIGVL